jgi:hypothetical protein
MPGIVMDPGAGRALKKLRKTDRGAAERIQRLVDEIEAGRLPQGSCRLHGRELRGAFGVLPHKVADGKLRVIFVPGERVIALGYRRDVYSFIGPGPDRTN